jgi:Flp pilus assembly protein TadG
MVKVPAELATCSTKCSTTSWVAHNHLAKPTRTESGQAAVEFALVLPFVILAVASLFVAARVIADQLALWHGAYAGAYAASIEPDNAEAIQRAVEAEAGISAVTVSTTRNDPYITVSVSKSQTIPLLIFGWSVRAFTMGADVTIHIQDS